MERITSRDNSRLKHVRKVRDGQLGGEIFIEGVRLSEEALRSEIEITSAFISERFADGERQRLLLHALIDRGIDAFELPERVFASIGDTNTPQGIVLLGKRPADSLERIEKCLGANVLPIVLHLEQINNPSNLGAIIRTAEAAGIAGVTVSKNSANIYSPKALRAAMGSSFRVAICTGVDVEEAVSWSKTSGLRSTAADINGVSEFTEIDWKIPRLLIFGSEAHGLSSKLREAVDETIYIPMENGAESLNLAVSCGIILFEAKRQNAEARTK